MSKAFPTLFSESKLGDTVLKNRFIVAPMTRISAEEDGSANETMEKYYERFAKGGFAAVISEGIYPDEAYSQGYKNQPGIASLAHIEAWRPVVHAVRKHGALFIAQLMHGGGQVQGSRYHKETIAPSAIAPKGEQLKMYGGSGTYSVPKEMTHEDLHEVKKAFVAAAANAREAGFDGVELHSANGYLLDEFLTEYSNQRNDEYGGSIQNRLRFLMEILEDVKRAAGNDMIIGVRISQAKVSDQGYKWPGGERDAEKIFSTIGEAPIDYIHVTDSDASAAGFHDSDKTMAAAAKEYGKLPVIANGAMHVPKKAEQLIAHGGADFVSLATGALANPDAPARIQKGIELTPFDPEAILLPQAFIKETEINAEIV